MSKFAELRKRKYRTAQDLAERLQIPRERISQWEAGNTAPKVRDLRKVAKALGVSVNTLLACFEENNDETDEL